jgi:hypothetical protein
LHSSCIVDLAGDGFFFSVVEQNRQKDWVKRIYVGYIIFFSLSCLVSGLSMLVKMQIIRQKLVSRQLENSVAVAPTTAARAPLQATPRSRQLTDFTKSVAAVADVARMESKKKVAHLEEKVRVPSRRSALRARSSVLRKGWGW